MEKEMTPGEVAYRHREQVVRRLHDTHFPAPSRAEVDAFTVHVSRLQRLSSLPHKTHPYRPLTSSSSSMGYPMGEEEEEEDVDQCYCFLIVPIQNLCLLGVLILHVLTFSPVFVSFLSIFFRLRLSFRQGKAVQRGEREREREKERKRDRGRERGSCWPRRLTSGFLTQVCRLSTCSLGFTDRGF